MEDKISVLNVDNYFQYRIQAIEIYLFISTADDDNNKIFTIKKVLIK